MTKPIGCSSVLPSRIFTLMPIQPPTTTTITTALTKNISFNNKKKLLFLPCSRRNNLSGRRHQLLTQPIPTTINLRKTGGKIYQAIERTFFHPDTMLSYTNSSMTSATPCIYTDLQQWGQIGCTISYAREEYSKGSLWIWAFAGSVSHKWSLDFGTWLRTTRIRQECR